VVDDNHDPTAGFGQMTLYRFKVLEAFKGISPDTKEVFIDPASMTSCYTAFSTDKNYLVYTGGGVPIPAAITILRGTQFHSSAKQIPQAWKGLEQLPVYTVGVCSPTRTVEEGDADLTFLRASAKDGAKGNGWIEGRTVQNFGYPYRFADFVAAADAIVTATAAAGDRKTAAVRQDGTFKIGPVPPGVYAISAVSVALGKGKFSDDNLQVPSGGWPWPKRPSRLVRPFRQRSGSRRETGVRCAG
jgi:hypothetical protein